MSDNLQMTQEGRKYIAAQKAKQENTPEFKDCSTCATDCDWPDGHNCQRYTKKHIEHRDMVHEELIASQAREAELQRKLEIMAQEKASMMSVRDEAVRKLDGYIEEARVERAKRIGLERENAELTRKLAEQQAILRSVATAKREGSIPQQVVRLQRIARAQDDAELRKLLEESKVPYDSAIISNELARFLNGSDCIDGVWFGEEHPQYRGRFWWRKLLPTQPKERPSPETDLDEAQRRR